MLARGLGRPHNSAWAWTSEWLRLTPLMAKNSSYPLLDKINRPEDLRQLPESRMEQVAAEVRAFLTDSVSQSGGHFAAGLGSVELTVALHYLFDTPHDRIVWDVGHQGLPAQDPDRT